MGIEFKTIEDELILVYELEMVSPDAILEKIEKDGNWNISRCFFV
jgi:hypothetical protein